MERSLTEVHERVAWGVAGVVIASFVCYTLYAFFGALVVGLFLYYAIRPVYRWLDPQIDHPDVTATLTLLFVGVPVALVLGYAGFLGVREFDQFLRATNVDQFRATLEPYVGALTSNDNQGLVGLLGNHISDVRSITTAAVNWALRLVVIVTVAFYLLRDDRKIARWFRRTFADHDAVVAFAERVDDDLTTIYTGNLITVALTGLIAAVVFYGLDFLAPNGTGVPFPILLGLLVGVATLIPAIGIKLVYFPYTGYLVWQALRTDTTPLWYPAVFFMVTLIAVDAFPDFIIRSYVSKGDINMGLMLITYVLGVVAFGWYGVFFGPVVLVFFLNFSREILPELL